MKRFVLLLAGLVLIAGFQNCAKVGVNSDEVSRSDKYGSIVVMASENGEDVPNDQIPIPPVIESDEPQLLCEELLKGNQGDKLVVGLNSIVSERGAMYVSSNHISLIDDYRGKLLVMAAANGERLKIDRIQHNSGRLILCNADVAELSDSNGRIDLVNSSIVACEGKVGNIKMDAQSSAPADCGHNTKVVALKH